jgi:hypothetical protein
VVAIANHLIEGAIAPPIPSILKFLLQSFQYIIGEWISIALQLHYPKLNAIDVRLLVFFCAVLG